MGHDVEHRCGKARGSAQSDPHIDVADLCRRRESHHPVYILRPDRRDRAEHHSAQSKHKQNVADRHIRKDIDPDHAPVYFDQQEDVALGDQRREHRSGGRRSPAVSVRHPVVEGEKSALDRESDGQDACRHDQHDPGARILVQHRDLALHRHHQKISRDIVQEHNAQKKQARPHQIEDHVAHRRQCRSADLAHDQDAAACQRQDLQKYVSGENIVGPGHRHQGCCHQVQDRVIDVDLALVNILTDIVLACQHRAQHHCDEQDRDRRFQRAGPKLIPPGGRKFSQHIGKGFPGHHSIAENRCNHD